MAQELLGTDTNSGQQWMQSVKEFITCKKIARSAASDTFFLEIIPF